MLVNSAPEGATTWSAAETAGQTAVQASITSRTRQETRHTGNPKYAKLPFRGFRDCSGIGECILVLGNRKVVIMRKRGG
jgi:hypothetical protein